MLNRTDRNETDRPSRSAVLCCVVCVYVDYVCGWTIIFYNTVVPVHSELKVQL